MPKDGRQSCTIELEDACDRSVPIGGGLWIFLRKKILDRRRSWLEAEMLLRGTPVEVFAAMRRIATVRHRCRWV
ncbi:hypothetical protein ANO11243_067460 [Dothideomycetidae sp. 11243]|nr:hypothetical protein ANO11243_067460 [fungal sp. No.11243]